MHTHHLDGHKEVKNRFVSDFATGTNLLLSKKQGNFMNRPGSRNRKNKKKIRGALAGAGIVALFLALMISFGKTAPENPMDRSSNRIRIHRIRIRI